MKKIFKKDIFLKHSCLGFGSESTLQQGSLLFLIHIWKFGLNCSTQLSLCYQKYKWKPKEVLENNQRHCHSQWKGEEGENYYLWLTVKSHWINRYKNWITKIGSQKFLRMLVLFKISDRRQEPGFHRFIIYYTDYRFLP